MDQLTLTEADRAEVLVDNHYGHHNEVAEAADEAAAADKSLEVDTENDIDTAAGLVVEAEHMEPHLAEVVGDGSS